MILISADGPLPAVAQRVGSYGTVCGRAAIHILVVARPDAPKLTTERQVPRVRTTDGRVGMGE